MPPEVWTHSGILQFLVLGYFATVAVEIPILFFGLSARYSPREKIIWGLLLTAFTYPIVILVIPGILTIAEIQNRLIYVTWAESYAAVVEVMFFRYLAGRQILSRPDRDAVVVVLANLCSFGIGELFLSGFLSRLIE